MAKRNISAGEEEGKRVVFVSSIVIGVILILLFYNGCEFSIISSVVLGTILAVINPFLAGLSVRISEALHRSAFPESYDSWDMEKKLWMGAFWPVTLLFWIVIFIFYFTINRVF